MSKTKVQKSIERLEDILTKAGGKKGRVKLVLKAKYLKKKSK